MLEGKKAKRIIHISIAVGLLVFAVVSFNFSYRVFNGAAKDNPPGHHVEVLVHDAMSAGDVARMLKEKGIVEDAFIFELQAKMKGYKPSKYTGSFELSSSMNAENILSELMNTTEKRK